MSDLIILALWHSQVGHHDMHLIIMCMQIYGPGSCAELPIYSHLLGTCSQSASLFAIIEGMKNITLCPWSEASGFNTLFS